MTTKYRAGIPGDSIVTDGTNGPGYGDKPGAPSSCDAYYGGKLIAESMDAETRRRLLALLNASERLSTDALEECVARRRVLVTMTPTGKKRADGSAECIMDGAEQVIDATRVATLVMRAIAALEVMTAEGVDHPIVAALHDELVLFDGDRAAWAAKHMDDPS